MLGNEVSNDRTWQGVIRMVVIHNRALTEAQIDQNFEAGVGERFYLLFSVSHLVNVPQSYVMFEASQFDSYSYLFTEPSFISLDGSQDPDQIRIQGVRIGVNGAEARVGQAYAPLDRTVTAAAYEPATGFDLANIGTVVALDKGPSADEFFLSFEQIATNTNPFNEPAPTPLPPPPDGDPASEIGLRTFEEISASMSNMTGVPTTNVNVAETYMRVREQLPTVENIEGFLSSHQVGAAQLAIEYCNELVNDNGLRAAYFPGFNFTAPAATAFDTPASARRSRARWSRARSARRFVAAHCRRNHGGSGCADRKAHDLRRKLRRRSDGSRGQVGLFGGHRQRQHAAAMRCLQR